MPVDKDTLQAIESAVRKGIADDRERQRREQRSAAELLRDAYESPEHNDPAATRERVTRKRRPKGSS
jgi:hypothetical protein